MTVRRNHSKKLLTCLFRIRFNTSDPTAGAAVFVKVLRKLFIFYVKTSV